MADIMQKKTVYGIAERRFNDGYIKAQIVAADEENIKNNPHYLSEVRTEYSTSLFHWIGSKEETESAMDNATIALYHNDISVGGYAAKDASEGDFIAWREHIAAGEDFSPEDITARLEF